MKGKGSCFQCGKKGEDLCGYVVCDLCRSKLGLFSDATIKRHVALYKAKGRSYKKEIAGRLNLIDRIYVMKKIKLLHIQERLEHI